MKKIILLGFFIFLVFFINAQSQFGYPFIYNYYQSQYNAHFQNWQAWQSDNGMMFFCNNDGIMTFDGSFWQLYPLPDSRVPRCITKANDGTIYVGGDGFFGKISLDSNRNIKIVPLPKMISPDFKDFRVIWNIFSIDSLLFIQGDKKVEIYSKNKFSIIKAERGFYNVFTDSKKNIYFIDNHVIHKYSNGKEIKIRTLEPVEQLFERNDSVFAFTINSQIFYLSKNNDLRYIADFLPEIKNITINNFIYKNGLFYVSSYTNGIYIFNSKGDLISHLDITNGLVSNNIYNIFVDNINNLWCVTNIGISYVDIISPLRIIDKRYFTDISNPGSLDLINGKIYSDAGFSLISIDLNNKVPDVQKVVELEGQYWNCVNIGNEIYACRNPYIVRIDKNNNVKSYGPRENIWNIVKIPYETDTYIVGANTGMYIYKYNGDSLKYVKKIPDFDKRARTIIFDSLNNLWIAAGADGIYKIVLNEDFTIRSIKNYTKANGLSNNSSMKFFIWKNKMFISTYKTLFEYDYQKDSIYEFHEITDYFDHSGKKVLQLVGIDELQNLYFEYHDEQNKINIFCLTYRNGKFIELYKSPRRLYGNGVSSLLNISRNTIFFGLSESYAVLNLDSNYSVDYKFVAKIRRVSIIKNDSAIFNGFSFNDDSTIYEGQRIKTNLKFADRNLRFSFSSPFFIEQQGILYRYKLENYDDEWSNWTFETKKEYTNLPPGSYNFVVEAKNIFNQVSEPANFSFHIEKPWYRTVLAFIVYFILAILLVYGIIKYFTYNLRKRNEKLEFLVDERTHELRLKNIELEQQKEEILTQAEELNIVNQQLEKFSTIIRETDNAIILMDREGNFIWVNNAYTKIFGYSLEDLVTNVSSNIISDKTEDGIKNLINECINERKTVKYEINLKNKNDKEIWVHTTLTPIIDDENTITDLVAIDADITLLKQAEKELQEQKDIITCSIQYAGTIQQSILPTLDEINVCFDSYIIYKPKDIVSGDFYWISNVFKTVDNRLTRETSESTFNVGNTVFFAVVDCTGHGVPGAFMSLIANHLLSEIINEQRFGQPKIVLDQLDVKLSKALKRSGRNSLDGMTVSICRFDKILDNEKVKLQVTFAGSKQHITYYQNSVDKFIKLRGNARQIAFSFNKNLQFLEQSFVLEINDLLFMYSDGLKDLNNSERMSFGHSKVLRNIKNNIDKPVEEIGKDLENNMNQWLGNSFQRDDIAFVILKMK